MKRTAMAAVLAGLAAVVPAGAAEQGQGVAEAVYAAVKGHMAEGWERLEAPGVATEAMLQSRGEEGVRSDPYAALMAHKALAVCVAWEDSAPGAIMIRAGGLAWRNPFADAAARSALFGCEKKKAEAYALDCKCQLLKRDDELVLDVPGTYLKRAAGED